MTDFCDKTSEELNALIAAAKAKLEAQQQSKRKSVIAEIKQLAASIGATVDIHEQDSRMSKVGAKYRDPETGKTWSGRGLPPKWLQLHVAGGGSKDDFLI